MNSPASTNRRVTPILRNLVVRGILSILRSLILGGSYLLKLAGKSADTDVLAISAFSFPKLVSQDPALPQLVQPPQIRMTVSTQEDHMSVKIWRFVIAKNLGLSLSPFAPRKMRGFRGAKGDNER